MPCYFPLQAVFSLRPDGKKDVKFSNANAKLFKNGGTPSGDCLALPCGRCMGCRLERSRQWAVRCLHESKCHALNCFVTLTYSDEFLPPNGTLVRKHVQDFMKRLRERFSEDVSGIDYSKTPRCYMARKIRVFYCGEYGDKMDRPHYHLCLFNCDFPDKQRLFQTNGNWNYVSEILSALWPFGKSIVMDFSFDTAAYVARYCTKKISGELAREHYSGKVPEFGGMSLKPGIGATWFDKFGKSDLIPHDSVVVNSSPSKPPRYYDVLWERSDPKSFEAAKRKRRELGEELAFDNTSDRLAVKHKILKSKTKLLVRKFENGV